MPLEITNLTLAYLLLELKPLIKDARVSKVQELGQDMFKFTLNTAAGKKNLIFSTPSIYLTQYKIPAVIKPKGFAEFLRSRLANKKIIDVKQHDFDRIIVFEFENYFLIFEHFATGNIILTDKEWNILRPLKKQEWSDRKIAFGEKYHFPFTQKISPQNITIKNIRDICENSNKDIVSTLISGINIAPQFAEEALFLAGVDKKKEAKKISDNELSTIVEELRKIYSDISAEKINAVVVNGKTLLPWPLKSIPACEQVRVVSINAALDDVLSTELLNKEKIEKNMKKNIEIEKITHSIAEQKIAQEKFQKIALENRKKAEFIYENYNLLNEIKSALKKAIDKNITDEEIISKINETLTKEYGAKIKLTKIDRKKMRAIFEVEE